MDVCASEVLFFENASKTSLPMFSLGEWMLGWEDSNLSK